MSWFKEPQRHAQARKGIRTSQRSQCRGMANPELVKYKLDNNIQKNITALDRKLRKISSMKSKKQLDRNIKEAETLYNRLSTKMSNHKDRYGQFPDWIRHDWVNNEKFGESGRVKKILNKIKQAEDKDIKKLQNELYNTIKFSTEGRR